MCFIYILFAAVAVCGAAQGQDIAIRNATVYTTSQSPALLHTTLIIRSGKIAALGRTVRIPRGTRILACHGCAVFAGFWNTHVHFTGPQWAGADNIPAAQLTHDMQAMLTHSGFTTVLDTSSDPANTVALRRRVESGEVAGSRIYTAGFGLYPPHGIPYYLDNLPQPVRAMLPQPESISAAIEAVKQNQALGTDIVKLFTGSYLAPDSITHMPVAIAQAAVSEAHKHSQLVFAHPSDLEGIRISIDSGVDVLAHAPSETAGIDNVLIDQLINHHMAMIPTLQLFSQSNQISRIRQIVTQFHKQGGVLLFGTDTGFLTDYDVAEEYRQLMLAGLSFQNVLAMLTTNPAAEFNVSSHAGSIKVGNDGDLTILAADPATSELRNFSRVLYTVRAGKVIFAAKQSEPGTPRSSTLKSSGAPSFAHFAKGGT